jgi:hypothetical protein
MSRQPTRATAYFHVANAFATWTIGSLDELSLALLLDIRKLQVLPKNRP